MASVGEALLDAFAPPLRLDGSALASGPSPAQGLTPAVLPDRRSSTGQYPVVDEASVEFVVSQRSALDGVVVTLPDPATGWQHLMYVSANLAATLGYEAEHLLGRAMVVLFGNDPPRRQLAAIDAQLDQGCQVEASHVLRHRSGQPVAVHATHTPLPSLHPATRYRLILFRDLSRGDLGRRGADELLVEQERLLASLARGQDLGSLCHDVAQQVEEHLAGVGRCWIGVIDPTDRLEAVITAGQEPDTVGRVLRLVMGSGDPTSARCVLVENLPADLARPLQESSIVALWAFPALYRGEHQRGALVVAHTAAEMPTNEEVRFLDHLSSVIAEGIERSALEAGLAHRALHDPLTRLPNRVLIIDRLEQALARLDRDPSSLSVLLVDIDRFKSVNDNWGPDVGDRVLMEVAGRLLAVVRLGDTVGRISSDQFLLICVANADFDPSVVARRVIRSLQEPIRLADGNELRITASVGVVVVDESGLSPSALIGNAESALASAVEGGRGRYALFDKGRQDRAQTRHAIEQALAAAVAGGELVVYYQPVCEVRVNPQHDKIFMSVSIDANGQGFIYTLPLVAQPNAADLQVFHAFAPGDIPDGIAFGRSGVLYVADATPFSSGIIGLRSNGSEVFRFTNPVNTPINPYDSPANIAFNGRGSMFVTNHAFATGGQMPQQFQLLEVYVNDYEVGLFKPLIP